jgi:arginine decarboxylase
VSVDDDNAAVLETVIKGDTVREVLGYVQFDGEVLTGKIIRDSEAAVRAGRLDVAQAGWLTRFYEEGLAGYTYLEERHDGN